MGNSYLTVAELIEELKKMPQNCLVYAKYPNFYFSKVTHKEDMSAVELK